MRGLADKDIMVLNFLILAILSLPAHNFPSPLSPLLKRRERKGKCDKDIALLTLAKKSQFATESRTDIIMVECRSRSSLNRLEVNCVPHMHSH